MSQKNFVAALLAAALMATSAAPALSQAAQAISPNQKAQKKEIDIALIRPGTFRLHNVEEAKALYDTAQGIGTGGIGDVPGFFYNAVFDAEPAIVTPDMSTEAIQEIIDSASSETLGGVIRFAPGIYKLGTIFLKSNTRIEVDPDATLVAQDTLLFVAGRGLTAETVGKAPQVQNFEVTSTERDKNFTIDLTNFEPKKFAGPFFIGNARNFAISNVTINDNYTQLVQVFLAPDANAELGAWDIDGKIVRNTSFARCPQFGVVQNVTGKNQHTGYGVSQVFCGNDILLKDLTGIGGTTVRLEPGSGPDHLNRAGKYVGNTYNIKIENLYNEGGFTSLYLKPHSKEIHNIDIKNIYAKDAGFAVMVDYGNQHPDDPFFGRGHFSNTKISGDISLVKTKEGEHSRIGRMGIFFIDEKTRDGRSEWDEFKPDPSGGRWKTADVVVPVLLAAEMSSDDVGPWHRGFYKVDLSEANITSENLIRDEHILYRTDAKTIAGEEHTDLINK